MQRIPLVWRALDLASCAGTVRRITIILTLALLTAPATSFAQSERGMRVAMKPGTSSLIDSAGCVKNVKSTGPGNVETPSIVAPTARTFVIFTATAEQRDEKTFTADVGPKESADGKSCEAAVTRKYTISFDASPAVSSTALESSFQILVAAFVIALLLESAFALLFNWRVFQAFLNGKAARTPIMLLGAWLVVHKFDFDLMTSLIQAYRPIGGAATGSWFTELLSAMILAGGSVGVNKILVTLGFRSLVKDDEVPPKLDDTQAWVSIEVAPKKRGDKVRVAITEVTPAAGVICTTTVGVAGSQKPTLRGLLLGENYRVPRAGGMRVETAKYYTITLHDLTNGGSYDVTGETLQAINPNPTTFRFGPRAFVDFRVKIN